MLQIRRPGTSVPTTDSPQRRLLACHDKIRMFTGLAGAIASTDDGAKDAEVVDAARRCLSYFGEDLPMHSADEDESLLPRLVATRPGAEVNVALEAMVRQHQEIEAVVDEACWTWARIVEQPRQRGALHVQLAVAGRQLAELFAVHLDIEERILFPLISSALSDEDHRRILREMEDRRRARPGLH